MIGFSKRNATALLSIVLPLTLTSCQQADDIIDSLDKICYQSFLHNESGQAVTVIMRPGRHLTAEECSWLIPNGSVVEIPDTERWGLTQRVYEADTVLFCFADGTTVLHTYRTDNYPSDQHVFVPQQGNIFCTGLGIPAQDDTWTTTKVRPQQYRCEYVILPHR